MFHEDQNVGHLVRGSNLIWQGFYHINIKNPSFLLSIDK
jgi:hypothetical protein